MTPNCTACGWCSGNCHACLAVYGFNYIQATPGGLAFSHDMFLNIPLLADWQAILSRREQLANDTLLCANKSVSILTTRLVKKSLNMTKCFMANWNQKLQDPLTFLGSTLTALWKFYCGLVLLNELMFAAPCHIGSPHLCNLIWNPWFSSSIMGRESVMPSCTSLMIPGNPLM